MDGTADIALKAGEVDAAMHAEGPCPFGEGKFLGTISDQYQLHRLRTMIEVGQRFDQVNVSLLPGELADTADQQALIGDAELLAPLGGGDFRFGQRRHSIGNHGDVIGGDVVSLENPGHLFRDGDEVIRQSAVLPRRHNRSATAQDGEGHPALGHTQRTQTPAGKTADGVGVGGVGVDQVRGFFTDPTTQAVDGGEIRLTAHFQWQHRNPLIPAALFQFRVRGADDPGAMATGVEALRQQQRLAFAAAPLPGGVDVQGGKRSLIRHRSCASFHR